MKPWADGQCCCQVPVLIPACFLFALSIAITQILKKRKAKFLNRIQNSCQIAVEINLKVTFML